MHIKSITRNKNCYLVFELKNYRQFLFLLLGNYKNRTETKEQSELNIEDLKNPIHYLHSGLGILDVFSHFNC